MEKLEDCAQALKSWNANHYGHIGKQLKEIEQETAECQACRGIQDIVIRLAALEKLQIHLGYRWIKIQNTSIEKQMPCRSANTIL